MSQPITIRPTNPLNLSSELLTAQADHPVLQNWVGHMFWAWTGGESMTVLVGSTPCPWMVIRHNGETRIVQGGSIRQAMLDEFSVEVVTD